MKKIVNKMIKNNYFLTTIFVVIIYLMYLCLMKIYPFGENSILKCDLYQQYVNFFCYLRDVLINGKSIMMSWNLGLANNFFTTFAYYLASPINIIVVFFESINMDIFVEILTLIKIILIANSAVFYFTKSYEYKKKDVILFGIIYAYCSFVICYSFHIMWLDSLYMLPITLYFIDEYAKGGKIYPIIICLAYSILTNYYLGFIVAFFGGIYYLARYYIDNNLLGKENIKKFAKKLLLFLIAIIIAFGVSMVLFLPSIKQLSGNMTANTKLIDINYDKIRLFINVIFNNYVYTFTQKSCMMFSSTLIVFLIPMYYLNKKISIKEKVAFTSVIIFMLLPIISPFLDKLWHGFTNPNCFYYRYSFALIFTTIIMAFREYQNKEGTRKWHFIFSIMIFSILTLIEFILSKMGYLESDGYSVSTLGIMISCIIYILITIIIYIMFNVKNKKIIDISKAILFIVIIIDLLIGAKSGQNNNDKYFKKEKFNQYDSVMERILSKIESLETERIVFTPDVYGSNMSMKYGYSNIGFFTSARNRNTIKAMYNLGYNIQRDTELWITSFSGTFFNYDIAGVKYYITKDKLEDGEIYGFEYEESYDGFNIYKNMNAFDIGYYLKDNITTSSKNPFEVQNEYISNLQAKSNTQKRYFEKIEDADIISCNKTIDYDEVKKEYKVKYVIRSKKDTNLYLCSDNNLQLYIDGQEQFIDYANIWSTETGIKPIKHLNVNEDFEFEISTKSDLNKIYIYASDNYLIQEVLENKNEKNKLENVEILSDGLKGMANFEDDGYLAFSIGYDEGWNIYVDGKPAEKTAIADAFLGLKLEKGTHEIQIYYEAPGYKLGLGITICSIIFSIAIMIWEIKKNR